jgi:hypothetical protein
MEDITRSIKDAFPVIRLTMPWAKTMSAGTLLGQAEGDRRAMGGLGYSRDKGSPFALKVDVLEQSLGSWTSVCSSGRVDNSCNKGAQIR